MLATRGGPGLGPCAGDVARRPARRARRCARAWSRSSRRRRRRRGARRTRRARASQLLGRLREDRLAVGALHAAGPALGMQWTGTLACLAEVADRVAHVLGAGRAVESDDVDPQALEDRQHRLDVGAEEHLAAVRQQRHRDLDRHRAADPLERLAGAEDRGLDLEDVLGGLDDDQVGAALDQRAGLLVEDLARAGRRRCRRASGRRRRAGSRSGRSSRRRSGPGPRLGARSRPPRG